MHIKTFKSLSKSQFQWVSGKIDLVRRTCTEVRGKVYTGGLDAKKGNYLIG